MPFYHRKIIFFMFIYIINVRTCTFRYFARATNFACITNFSSFLRSFYARANYNPGKIGLYKYNPVFLRPLCKPSNLDFIYKILFLLDLHKGA